MKKSSGTLRILLSLSILAIPLAAGCGKRSTTPFGRGVPSQPKQVETEEESQREVYTSEDVARTGAVTIWEALDRLVKYAVFTETSRGAPDRIRRRGASTINLREDMMVVVDGLKILDVTALDEMPAGIITRIEVLSGLDGTTRYGTNATDGVILVSTRAPAP